MRILVLCHGNMYRSPLFGAVVRAESSHEVRTRGFSQDGRRVPMRMQEEAREFGVELEDHRSRHVTGDDLLWAEQIVYMDAGQQERLAKILPIIRKRGPVVEPVNAGRFVGRSKIPDPAWLGGKDAFAEAVRLIEAAARNAVRHWERMDEPPREEELAP